jgi:hypothetical protein
MCCSEELDVQSNFGTFFSIMLNLRLKPDTMLGNSTLVRNDETSRYIDLDIDLAADGDRHSNKLCLDGQRLACSGRLFGNSMARYRPRLPNSSGREYVVERTLKIARLYQEASFCC